MTFYVYIKRHLMERMNFTSSHAKALIATMMAIETCKKFRKWWAAETTTKTTVELAEFTFTAEGFAAIYERDFIIPFQKAA